MIRQLQGGVILIGGGGDGDGEDDSDGDGDGRAVSILPSFEGKSSA